MRKWDWLTALLLACVIGLIVVLPMTNGHDWGDDFAAYMNTAIAISEGRLQEQELLNAAMHPSPLTFLNAEETSMSYVWGYPLMLSAVYRIFGFDTVQFSSLIFYKLPGAACYALLCAILFLMLRRRFSYGSSLIVTLLFALNQQLLQANRHISTDIPFLFWFMLCLWLTECLLDQTKPIKRILLGFALGFSLWACYVTRLNGVTALVLVAAMHVIWLIRNRKRFKSVLLSDLVPYAVFALLLLLSYRIFSVPTSNSTDLGKITWRQFQNNLSYYFDLLTSWASGLFSYSPEGIFASRFIFPAMLILGCLGILWSKQIDLIPYLIFIIGMYLSLCLLNYQQGLRYLYPVLPMLLILSATGLKHLIQIIQPHFDDFLKRRSTFFCRCATLLIAGLMLFQTLQATIDGFQHRGDDLPHTDAYSVYAVDAYRFIQNETPTDARIAFFKPRALYLNTGRIAFKPSVSADVGYHEYYLPLQPQTPTVDQADYLLLYNDSDGSQFDLLSAEYDAVAASSIIYENDFFILYQLSE